MLTYYCAVPENIHTPPNGRDWNFQMGGGGRCGYFLDMHIMNSIEHKIV